MKKSNAILLAVAALVVGGVIGYVVHQPQPATGGFAGSGSFAGRGSFRGAATGASGNTFADGQIVSINGSSMTIQLRDGSSQVVFFSTSTPILTTTAGSAADLAAQKDVMVAGTKNADGSITAQSIQVRPQGAQPAGR